MVRKSAWTRAVVGSWKKIESPLYLIKKKQLFIYDDSSLVSASLT